MWGWKQQEHTGRISHRMSQLWYINYKRLGLHKIRLGPSRKIRALQFVLGRRFVMIMQQPRSGSSILVCNYWGGRKASKNNADRNGKFIREKCNTIWPQLLLLSLHHLPPCPAGSQSPWTISKGEDQHRLEALTQKKVFQTLLWLFKRFFGRYLGGCRGCRKGGYVRHILTLKEFVRPTCVHECTHICLYDKAEFIQSHRRRKISVPHEWRKVCLLTQR